MGVKGLNSALNINSIKGSHNLSSLTGLTLAVDISVWLHQFLKSKPRIYQIQFLGCNEDYVDDLEEWLNERMEIFIHWNITLIFVGEGDRNPLKSLTNEKRRNLATIARTNLDLLCQNPELFLGYLLINTEQGLVNGVQKPILFHMYVNIYRATFKDKR